MTVRLTEPLIRKDSAGAFDIDWKEGVAKAVRKTYHWPVIARELRVRTAIDSVKRKAKDQDLFAWQMLKPYGIEWNATADSAALCGPAREQLYRLLLLGLEPIGKTQARSSVAISPANQGAVVVTAPDYLVTLQTPALLIDPSRHLAPGGSIGSAKEDDLRQEYEEVWTSLSHGSLELINYFQRCSLAGGEYYWRRFSKAKGQYKPYLLSDAGSTFLLKAVVGQESEGLGKLNEWRSHGLPLSQEICAFYRIPNDVKVQWDHCPYVPQNGYGEIAVNEKCPYPEA